MITTNPFAQLNAGSPDIFTSGVMQAFVVVMILLVIGGTIYDVIHKKSAKYFFENAKRAKENQRARQLSSSEKNGLLLKTITNEVLTSSEFANQKRRLSHLLTMYGFILFVISTAIMIFAYPTAVDATPALFPILWHLGALMLCVGGYWFWFAIRVDVSAEGKPWYKISPRGDMFVLSLLAMCTFALIWSFGGAGVNVFFGLFILSTVVLFGGVVWSKFAHMFFKPAAAYQKKQVWADGSRENLPEIGDLSDPALHERFPDIPTYMGKNPPNMGAGINREASNHY